MQTLQELSEVLSPDSSMYNEFENEVLSKKDATFDVNIFEEGVFVYYPDTEHLVTYAPPKWHKYALILRNSLLIRDPQQNISWKEQREIFDSLVIGVAGASVGKNAFKSIIDTLHPKWMKIADPKVYKDSNSNRTDLAYWDIGKNKAVVAAQQIHRNNPFINISVYSDGLNDVNMDDFVGGDISKGEPELDYLIEETDDPIRKIESLRYAKKYKIPFCMVTDVGSAYQIDFRDFKKKPNMPLMYGIKNEEIFTVLNEWNKDKSNTNLVLGFAAKLLGNKWLDVPEFKGHIFKEYIGTSKELPQLGIAARAGGSHLALMIAKHALGEKMPERVFVNLATRKITEETSVEELIPLIDSKYFPRP